MSKGPSIQAIHRRRRLENFIGREGEIESFRHNLQLSYEDRKYIWNIFGQGGIGKTTLIKRFQILASEQGALTALTDESQFDILDVLGALAEQLKKQGKPLKAFDERYRTYRQLKEQIESDPNLPSGISTLLGRVVGKVSVAVARQVPGAGIAVDFMGEEPIVGKFGEFASYLAHKIGNKDEVRLVLEPLAELTPLFLEGLNNIASDRQVILGFDTYEKTHQHLDKWLRSIFEGSFGDLNSDILIIIAGREKLDSNWTDYLGLIQFVYLDKLSEEEARDFLTIRGVTEPEVVNAILRLSGRIPLWLATLTSQVPKNSVELGDPTDEAIERFLKWVDDKNQYRTAVLCALPQRLDRDVISVLIGEDEASTMFEWLKTQPFIEQKAGEGWTYHNVVRDMMLRYLHKESLREWKRLNELLANYYLSQQTALGIEPEVGINNIQWVRLSLSYLYHKLFAEADAGITLLLESYVSNFHEYEYATQIGETARLVGGAIENETLSDWGQQMVDVSNSYSHGQPNLLLAISLLNRIESKLPSNSPQLLTLLRRRASTHSLANNNEKALEDLTKCLQGDSSAAKIYVERARIFTYLDRDEEALADYTSAVNLKPTWSEAFASRSRLLLTKGRTEEALSDLNCAINADPEDAWHLISRAEIHKKMGQDEEALADLTLASQVNPQEHHFLGYRADLLTDLGRYEEALADYTRAAEMRDAEVKAHEDHPPLRVGARVLYVGPPDYEFRRGQVYHRTGRYDEALADYTLTIEREHEKVGYLWTRATLLEELGRNEEALRDKTHAIAELTKKINDVSLDVQAFSDRELAKPHLANLYFNRAQLLSSTEQNNQALEDYKRAIENAPDNPEYYISRAGLLRSIGLIEEALGDYDHAIKLESNHAWSFTLRAGLLEALGRVEEALGDHTRALEITPKSDFRYGYRADLLREMGRDEEALTDYTRAIELKQTVKKRSETPTIFDMIDEGRYVGTRDYEVRRGYTYYLKGEFDKALADYNRALELNPTGATEARNGLGIVLNSLGRYEESLGYFTQVLSEEPENLISLYNEAVTKALLKGVSAVKEDIQRAENVLRTSLDSQGRPFSLYGLGGLKALEGDIGSALDYLKEAIALNRKAARWACHDPAWNELRSDSHFHLIVSCSSGI
jgi:tetratricopeptide (TPR) repeat protein